VGQSQLEADGLCARGEGSRGRRALAAGTPRARTASRGARREEGGAEPMCEFCLRHGEGKRWYLQAKNYSDDLVSDVRRRRIQKAIEDIHPGRAMRRLDALFRTRGIVRRFASWALTRKMKKVHFGQVVPIEDIEQILRLTSKVVRVACLCRYLQGRKDARYCYGVSIDPGGGPFLELMRDVSPDYALGPETSGLETLSREEALERMRAHEREGLCHTVWTAFTPFIAGICNCDLSGCLGMRLTVEQGFKVFFRAEYVARCEPAQCTGCRRCVRICPFGAVEVDAATKKAWIDPRRCYGCGVCRSVCTAEAVSLVDRRTVQEAKDLW
jgi:ferredoxin